MDEKRIKVRCPIHRTFLTQENIYSINLWFCQECDQYYSDRDFTINSGTALINNKHVIKFPDNIIVSIQNQFKENEKETKQDKFRGKNTKIWINPNYKSKQKQKNNSKHKAKVEPQIETKKKGNSKHKAKVEPQIETKRLKVEHDMHEFTLPKRIQTIPHSSIVKVKLFRQNNTAVGECIIVENVNDQSTKDGIFWVGRKLSSEIMSAIIAGENRFVYHHSQFKIANQIEKCESFSRYSKTTQEFCDKNHPKTVHIFNQKNLEHYKTNKYSTVTAFFLCEKAHKPVLFSVYYLESEDKYFMNMASYQIYKEKYGLPYIKLKTAAADLCGSGYLLSDHSELNLYGYAVGGKDRLTDHERKLLISQLLNSGLMKKHMIINHLEWLIHTREGSPNMESACNAWKSEINLSR